MSTDRELLELAAKAAGYVVVGWDDRIPDVPIVRRHDSEKGHFWMPLADDGDALQLSVKTGEPFVVRTSCVTTMSGIKEDFNPAIKGDDLRATRRAIVRAAAEIGRQMGAQPC